MSHVTAYLGRWGEGKGPTNFCEQEVLSPETVRTLLFKQPLAKEGLKVVSTSVSPDKCMLSDQEHTRTGD